MCINLSNVYILSDTVPNLAVCMYICTVRSTPLILGYWLQMASGSDSAETPTMYNLFYRWYTTTKLIIIIVDVTEIKR